MAWWLVAVFLKSWIMKNLPHNNIRMRIRVIEQGKIEFRNVSFSYDGENHVLKNISFTAYPGETVALVGHTGSGKSSIINVLMRFYEFGEGQILIDDHDIRDFTIEELRKNRIGFTRCFHVLWRYF